MDAPRAIAARRLTVGGRVQGVGFRPFVYRLATGLGLAGSVRNLTGRVEIRLEGAADQLDRFARELVERAPPLARPTLLADVSDEVSGTTVFEIESSSGSDCADIHVPPDCFTCDSCLDELRDAAERRHRYPFINCTQCGPRYTIIAALPYDRPNTSMAGFRLCAACATEYQDPGDRRFHAQPLACAACGPTLWFDDGARRIDGNAPALAAAVATIERGGIVAIKGVGGYHLVCDAGEDATVARLRERKRRPDKPLAVMFPWRGADGLDAVRAAVAPDTGAAALLAGPLRPIVLCPKAASFRLSRHLAPGLGELGVLLPYSPLHQLLLDALDRPLVATSGNLSGEPVLTDPDEAQRRLAPVADAFLHHDRPILRPADDPVFRPIAGRPRALRLGRGIAPLELELPFPLARPTLATGGHLKNTLALGWGRRAVVSPHIGELDAPRALTVFDRVASDLQALYGVAAERIAHDAHPGYGSSRWAARQGLPLIPVQHHLAHASGLAGESPEIDRWLVFAWDGVGYGTDATLWGGEVLLGAPGRWRRVGSLRTFRLPGGDRAGREPWRSAAALCWESGIDWQPPVDNATLAYAAWQRDLNCPRGSAAGRLFDAAAALLLERHHASFEGEGPMRLEALAATVADSTPLALAWVTDADGLARLDWSPLLALLRDRHQPAALRAHRFHTSLARAIAALAETLHAQLRFDAVGLTGGVFQNRLLSERVAAELGARGLALRLAERVPGNDGGLAFGQLVEASRSTTDDG